MKQQACDAKNEVTRLDKRAWWVIAAIAGMITIAANVVSCGSPSATGAFQGPATSRHPVAVQSSSLSPTLTTSLYLPVMEAHPSGWWQPPVGTQWQWQLTGLPIDQSFDVAMYDIDLFDNDTATVTELQARGHKVVCYISVGSWEDWRPDAAAFPKSVLGNAYDGWPGERWLDIRRLDILGPLIAARLDQCQAKGFDGVEPDNMDGYTNNTGFPLTYADQLTYNLWLANEAHARGLSIGLKNNEDQVSDLVAHFDWALTEDCYADGWCEAMRAFADARKAVFAAEYTDAMTPKQFLNQVCPQAAEMQFSVILKNRDLDAWRQACPQCPTD